MSDPESMMMLERFSVGELIETSTWAAVGPRKEHPGGLAIHLCSLTKGMARFVRFDTV